MESGLAAESGVELVMIRHAPADTRGRLIGRTDVPATADGLAVAAGRLAHALSGIARRVSSPALRCRQSASAIWPGETVETIPGLHEQDFGVWEGLPLSDVPDLGPLPVSELARHRPPGGESFEDLCERVQAALLPLTEVAGQVAVVAHGGTIRAALALAVGTPATALAFEVSPLSVTRLRRVSGAFSITCVNCPPR